MINPKELRIGNFIIDDDGLLARVIGFAPHDDEVRCDVEGGCWIIIDAYEADGGLRCEVQSPSIGCRPIPLTPEWLEKCGKVSDSSSWQYAVSVGALKWYFRWNTEWYSEIGGIYIDSRVQYLHQVQNLIHALTGQELTIKL